MMSTRITSPFSTKSFSQKNRPRFGNYALPRLPQLDAAEKAALIEAVEGLVRDSKKDIRGFMLPQGSLQQIWVVCPDDSSARNELARLQQSADCSYNGITHQLTRKSDAKPVFVATYQDFLGLLRA